VTVKPAGRSRIAKRPAAAPRARTIPFPDPTVRWKRVEGARARIAAEFYDRVDVRDRLVEALLAELKER
jgi:hypothetical protein